MYQVQSLRVVGENLGADVGPGNARKAANKEARGKGAPALRGLKGVTGDLTASQGLDTHLGSITLSQEGQVRIR